jgi:hypothetical protein
MRGQYETGQASLDYKRSKEVGDLAPGMRAAKALGKSYPSQVGEIFKLGRGFGKLEAADYYRYGLYNDSRYSFAQKKRFLSDRIHDGIIARVCDKHWWAIADDKFVAYTFLSGLGASIPATQAVFVLSGRNFGSVPALRSMEALRQFLAGAARFPLFAKPVAGIASFGAFRLERFDAAADAVILTGEGSVGLNTFTARLGTEGYLLQDAVVPHPLLAETCGPHVSTVRLVVVVEEGKAEIVQTVLKIAAAGNVADNFWRPGNMLASIDGQSGVLLRVVQGFLPEQSELQAHPDTGKTLVGLRLPHWQKVLDSCLELAMDFAPLRFQSWDIAIGADGPIFIEVNTGASFMLSQVATGEGFLTDRFAGFLSRSGFRNIDK